MMRTTLAMLVAIAALSGVALADSKDCLSGKDCAESRALDNRGRTPQRGGPDPHMVCFSLLMRDPDAAVWLKIVYDDGREHKEEFRRGKVAQNSGPPEKGRLPLFCIADWKLKGAASALLCTATEGDTGSATFRRAHLERLLRERNIPQDDPACLLGTSHCKAEGVRTKEGL